VLKIVLREIESAVSAPCDQAQGHAEARIPQRRQNTFVIAGLDPAIHRSGKTLAKNNERPGQPSQSLWRLLARA
jgi:hypothetical protein